MKKILSITMLIVGMTASAQKLTTTTDVMDVGQVVFNTPASATFELKNKSSKPIIIRNIETSCGCTTATGSVTTVPGGGSFEIVATYDGKTMGHFNKQIWVYEDDTKQPTELTLRGVVVEEVEDFAGNYPYTIGQIKSDVQDIEFDDVFRGQMPQQEMHIFNSTSETIQPVIMHLPSYLRAEVSPTKIRPNKGGVITFTLLSDKLNDLGLSQSRVFLGKYPGDKVAVEKEITTSVVLLPSFGNSKVIEVWEAPQIELASKKLSMSEMTGKPNKLKGEIFIKNTGRSTLDIRSLQMFTAGLRVSLPKQKIEPNEIVKVKIQVDSVTLKKQHTRPRILMITNDPKNPKVIIEITE